MGIIAQSAFNPLIAKLIEEKKDKFGMIWVSGFEASTSLLLPDNGTITRDEMLRIVRPIIDAVDLPVLVDCDTGYGDIKRTVKLFERTGIWGISIEDNLEQKTNSLFGGKVPLMDMKEFGEKIKKAKKYSKNLKIIARTEALIRKYGMKEAIKRGEYYASCGADYILIHSREETGKEALEIPKRWKWATPLVIVNTKFPHLTYNQLFKAGYEIIIEANRNMRQALKAWRKGLKIMYDEDCPEKIEKEFSSTLDDMRGLTDGKF